MSASKIELVQRAFEAYRRRDLDSLLSLLARDVEVKSLMTEAERTTYRGHEGVRDWFDAVFDVFPDWQPTIEDARELGDAVVASFRVIATGAGSGVPIDQCYWHASRLRDGRIAWFGFFRTEADAHEALSGK